MVPNKIGGYRRLLEATFPENSKRNMVSLFERNQRWNMVANKIGGSWRLPEAPGGDLK